MLALATDAAEAVAQSPAGKVRGNALAPSSRIVIHSYHHADREEGSAKYQGQD